MTALSLAVQRTLARDTELTSLLAKSAILGPWVFDEKPTGAKIERTQKCLIVINEGPQWTSPNTHNTLKFPTLLVDIWADPTRNPDGSVQLEDAKAKIEAIQKQVDRVLNLIDSGTPAGGLWIFGTEAQVTSKTGVAVSESKRSSGPEYAEVTDSEGSWMGRLTYNVQLL